MLARLRADLNVIDYDRLPCTRRRWPTTCPPAAAACQRASGYSATVVAGQVTYRDGVATDALPGRLVRGGKAAGGGGIELRGRPKMTPRNPRNRLRVARRRRRRSRAWTEQLSPAEVAEIDAAIAHARAKSPDLLDIERADFPLRPWARG